MATTFKITWFFEGVQRSEQYSNSFVGWTESWYVESDSIDAALQAAANTNPGLGGSYLGYRLLCMPNMYRCVWVRASDPSNPRISKTAAVRNGSGILPPQTGNTLAAQVTCALLVDFTVLPYTDQPGLHHRRFLIRGLSTTMINGNIVDRTAAAWSAMENFLNYLGKRPTGSPVPVPSPQGPYTMRHQSATPTKIDITALSLGVNGQVFSITAALGPVSIGQKVILTGIKFPLNLNRTWTFIQDSPGGVYVLGRSRKQLSGLWVAAQGGFAVIDNPKFKAPDQYLVIGLRTRHTGRPFRLTRGRRSVH